MNRQMMNTIQTGAAVLDEKEPGWRDRIAPADLDMEDCLFGVLRQLFGSYTLGVESLRFADYESIIACGFEEPDEAEWTYQELNEAWLGYIKGEWS